METTNLHLKLLQTISEINELMSQSLVACPLHQYHHLHRHTDIQIQRQTDVQRQSDIQRQNDVTGRHHHPRRPVLTRSATETISSSFREEEIIRLRKTLQSKLSASSIRPLSLEIVSGQKQQLQLQVNFVFLSLSLSLSLSLTVW